MRSDWTLPLCTGEERLKDARRQEGASDAEARGAAAPRDPGDSTKPGDVVLDPFFGTGTTGAVAKQLGRRFIGIEREANYVAAAEKRIAAVKPLATPTAIEVTGPSDGAARAVRRRSSRRACCAPGDRAVRRQAATSRRWCAPTAALALGDHAARSTRSAPWSQARRACNGWTFWHFKTPKGLPPIDVLRAKCAQRWRKRRSSYLIAISENN